MYGSHGVRGQAVHSGAAPSKVRRALLLGRLWFSEERGEGVDGKGLVGEANLRATYI